MFYSYLSSCVDSLLIKSSTVINANQDSLFHQLKQINFINKRNLRETKVEWQNYHTAVKKAQKTIKLRTEEITSIRDEMVSELKKWEETKKLLYRTRES